MDLENKLVVKFFIIMWDVLIHAHPSQTTIFNDIFWAGKSTISTGMCPHCCHMLKIEMKRFFVRNKPKQESTYVCIFIYRSS